MKRLKFRAFNYFTKEMLRSGQIGVIECVDGSEKPVKVSIQPENLKYHGEVVMQYFGVKDKKGVEIYEGDILKDYEGNLGRVFYCETRLAFMISWFNKDNGFKTNNNFDDVEIVGNIHENPELYHPINGGVE